jgi:hypothetical protein
VILEYFHNNFCSSAIKQHPRSTVSSFDGDGTPHTAQYLRPSVIGQLFTFVLANNTVAPNMSQSVAATMAEADSISPWLYHCAVAILTYGPPFLLVLATIGNTTSVIVLQHPSFRKSSTSFILSALAVIDAVLVDTGLLRLWMVMLSMST